MGQASTPHRDPHARPAPPDAPCVRLPGRPAGRRALAWVLALTLGFAAVEVAGGLLSGALVLLADAAHMATDAAAVGLSLFAAWVAQRPATPQKTYGYYRLEILAALVNGAVLIAVTAGIVLEAVERLRAPQGVRPGLLLAVAAAGLAANLAAVAILHRAKGESLNLRGAYLHVLSDVLGSLAALGAGAIIALTGWLPADPLLSMVLALLILVSAVRLVVEAVDVLLEATPAHVSLAALADAIATVPGVTGVHDLHVWTVSSGIVAMSTHATAPRPADHQRVLEEIDRRVRGFGIQHVTVQIEEHDPCVGGPDA
jgi:cobalt-zinc-cadmium efflux system protein